MYYDDEARKFNFLSGFAIGAVLGLVAGLATRPLKRASGSVTGRRGRASLPELAAGGVRTVVGRAKRPESATAFLRAFTGA
jgi:gas vesicle protein